MTVRERHWLGPLLVEQPDQVGKIVLVVGMDDTTGVADSLRQLADRVSTDALSKKKVESAVDDILGKRKWSGVKGAGVSVLEPAVQVEAQFVIDTLERYGISIVPVSELESWIPLQQTKSRWVAPALDIIFAKETPEPLKQFVNKLLRPTVQSDGNSFGGTKGEAS